MLRKMGILLAALALGAAANAEELREIEYEAIYEEFRKGMLQGQHLEASKVFALRSTKLTLSTLEVYIATPQQERIRVKVHEKMGTTDFPLDESLIGSKVLTNAPSGGLGVGALYNVKFETGDSLPYEDIIGGIREYNETIDELGFFARLLAKDLTGFSVPFDDDENPTATIGTTVIRGDDSWLFLPIDVVTQNDFSEIKFSSVPSGVYLSVE